MLWGLITAEPNSQDLSTTVEWEQSTAYRSDMYPCKVLEGFYPCCLIAQVSHQIDPRPYEHAGHSPADVLVYLLHAVYEAVDTENCGVRLFFADYSKGFDMIDHSIS